MENLRLRLQNMARDLSVPMFILEKDYAISHLLVGISSVKALQDKLVFKGGTALKKYYYGDYRFSEDLDFTLVDGIPDEFDELFQQAADKCLESMRVISPVEVILDELPSKNTHPGGQLAKRFRVRYPWQPNPMCSIKVEVTIDEIIVLKPERVDLIHEYGDILAAPLNCYSITEITLEKLRAILQTRKSIEEHGWTRVRPRDFYDLWRLLSDYADGFDKSVFQDLMNRKCSVRDVSFSDHRDFFDSRVIALASTAWEPRLSNLLSELPPFDQVMGALRVTLNEILG